MSVRKLATHGKKSNFIPSIFLPFFSALSSAISTEKLSHMFRYERAFELMNKPTRWIV